MRIFLIASRHLYNNVDNIKRKLEKMGHVITTPNGFGSPFKEDEIRHDSKKFVELKQELLLTDRKIVEANDAVLVLNYEKNGMKNYIGGSVLLEMYCAWSMGKKIFLMNPIPDNMLKDEITGLSPIIINGDLSKIQ